MSKNLKSLTDQELEQANGGTIVIRKTGTVQNSACRKFKTEDECKAQGNNCQWEDGLCVPADESQPATRLL